jgi:hypothetical protein
MDTLDFLEEGQSPAPQTAAPEAQVEAPPVADTPSDSPARGPDGKFLPKAADAAPTPELAPEAPIEPIAAAPAQDPARPPEGYVPVAALQELRKELQALKQPPAARVDPHEDPEGAIYQTNFLWSQRLATAQHGQETVDEALQWAYERAERDQSFNAAAQTHADPVGFAIEEFQRSKALNLLADPKLFTAFQAFVSGQSQGQAPTPAPAAPVALAAPLQPPIPPRSLASAPNAGGAKPGEKPAGPQVAFDDTFKD